MSSKAKSIFFSFLRVALFASLCFIVSMAVIFPLWAFAKNAPQAYSVSVLVLASAVVLWKIALWTKKVGAKRALRIALKCLVVVAGIAACVVLLFGFHRILAVVAAVLTVILFKLVSKISR